MGARGQAWEVALARPRPLPLSPTPQGAMLAVEAVRWQPSSAQSPLPHTAPPALPRPARPARHAPTLVPLCEHSPEIPHDIHVSFKKQLKSCFTKAVAPGHSPSPLSGAFPGASTAGPMSAPVRRLPDRLPHGELPRQRLGLMCLLPRPHFLEQGLEGQSSQWWRPGPWPERGGGVPKSAAQPV